MRHFLALIAAICLGGTAAGAAEFADREILGFSPDGTYFAFEEYGVQDGSGFPYSNIYIVDTATDEWVEGTPVRVRVDDELADLTAVRAQAYAEVVGTIASLSIGVAGSHVVDNPVTELAESTNIDFLLYPISPLPTEGWTLRIEDIPLPASGCPEGYGDTYVGFDLWLTRPDGASDLINHDTAIPASRVCPLRYTISDVVAFDGANGTVLAILINVFSLGFEGPDRRFLAVTKQLAD